ncbi:MAG: cell division protein ZapA [Alphaproteobacteria bacterium]|nr:cell division protein ZapA [Alphaproteobacteria bacterium]
MAVVSLKIGQRFYKFSCADGQEAHMEQLAAGLDKRAEQLTKSLGFMQEGQLLAMICLLLAEEKSKLEKETNAELLEQSETKMVESLNSLALKITTLTENLQQ